MLLKLIEESLWSTWRRRSCKRGFGASDRQCRCVLASHKPATVLPRFGSSGFSGVWCFPLFLSLTEKFGYSHLWTCHLARKPALLFRAASYEDQKVNVATAFHARSGVTTQSSRAIRRCGIPPCIASTS